MIGRYQRELSVALALAGLLAVLAVAAPAFFRPDNLRNRLLFLAPTLVAAVGMTLVILARQIDISVGSQLSVYAVLAGLLAQAGWPVWAAGGAAVLTGAALGAINGLLVAGLGLPSIVVTLATLVVWREALRWWREGELVRNLPDSFVWFGAGEPWGPWVVVAAAFAVFAAFAWGLRYLAAGRAVYAVGSDAEAARLAGIHPRRVVFGVFTLTGALTGLAALLSAVQLSNVDPNVGTGLELRVIAAVVVGGTAVSGGRGTLAGSLLGAALLGVVGPALVFLGTEQQWEKAVQGLIILLAVASDALVRRGR
jgi:ribose/xylose/arabinose/galactoside ABC-type transport system permease subunit